MVFANLDASASFQNVGQTFDDNIAVGVGAIGAGSVGGFWLSDQLANFIMPAVGLSPSPNTVTDLVGATAVKGGAAVGALWGASRTDGILQVLLAGVAVGAIGSWGLDAVGTFTELPQLASGRGRVTRHRPRARPTASRSSGSSKPTASTSGGGGGSVGGGNFN